MLHRTMARVMVTAYGRALPRRVSIGARGSALDSVRHITAGIRAAGGLGAWQAYWLWMTGTQKGAPYTERALVKREWQAVTGVAFRHG